MILKFIILILQLLLSSSALHIGLVCPGHSGHLLPTATIGTELLQRGNRITLISNPSGSSTAEQNGLAFEPIGIPEFEAGALHLAVEQEGRLQGVSAFGHTLRLFAREQQIILRDLPRIIKERNIDAVCADQLLPASLDVAAVHGIPCAVLCNALPLHLDPSIPPFVTTWGPSNGCQLREMWNEAATLPIMVAASPIFFMLNLYRAKHRLSLHTRDTVEKSGHIIVTQLPRFVDFPRNNLPDHFFYTRPWHKNNRDDAISFPWDRLDGRPIIYASFGSVQTGQNALFLAVADACRRLDVQLVMSLGRKGASLPANAVPSNAVVVDYAPQLQILQKASAVLTHAGLNTAMEALACGLPIVTVPLCNDQPGIAARLVNLGVATIVIPGHAEPQVLQKAIVKVLTHPSYRLAATRCQQMMRDHCPSLAQTAEIIETGLGRSTPLCRDDPEVKRILGGSPSSAAATNSTPISFS